MNRNRHRNRRRWTKTVAGRWLFLVATVFAAAFMPLWLILRAMAYPSFFSWHGHEMLFGFGLAVVGGFLVTRSGRPIGWLLLASWAAGRAAALQPDASPWLLVIGIAFAVALFTSAALPLLRGAKRWENRIVPGILAAFVVADAFWWAGAVGSAPAIQRQALLAAVDLFALLMLIVGGRALPAAVGGYLERRGIPRRDRIRRGYELPLAVLMSSAVVLDAAGFGAAAGGMNLAAALITLVRLATWQLTRTLERPQLWTLALGYLWLVFGLLLKGLAQTLDLLPLTDALHGITVGALGTLTLVMMARTAALRDRQSLEGFGDVAVGVMLISIAALLRLLVPFMVFQQEILLWLAVTAWSAAFLLLLRRLLRTRRPI